MRCLAILKRFDMTSVRALYTDVSGAFARPRVKPRILGMPTRAPHSSLASKPANSQPTDARRPPPLVPRRNTAPP